MKKFLLIFVLLAATVFVSYKYSGRVYSCYLKFYYSKFYTENEIVSKSEKMYNQRKFSDLESFLEPVMIVYPGNNEVKKIAAYTYMHLGKALKAAELIAELDDSVIEENKVFEYFLKELFYGGHYVDLISFYDKKIMMNNVNTAFYYGVSLYKKGRYDESLRSLLYAKDRTFMLPELYFYIGLNLDRKGEIKESAEYIKTAYESDRNNQIYRKALIDIYRKNGLFREAEVLLRIR